MAQHDDLSIFSGGAKFIVATTNVNDTTPTAAELTTACPGITSGEIRIVNDAGGAVNFYLVASSNGTDRFFLKMTKAV